MQGFAQHPIDFRLRLQPILLRVAALKAAVFSAIISGFRDHSFALRKRDAGHRGFGCARPLAVADDADRILDFALLIS